MVQKSKAPRPAHIVPTDDFTVTVPGEHIGDPEVEYHPHAEEWVRMAYIPDGTRDYLHKILDDARALSIEGSEVLEARKAEAEEGEEAKGFTPEEAEKYVSGLGRFKDALRDTLAGVILEWTWTDNEGEPLPQPRHNPAAFRLLDDEELWYLAVAALKPPLPNPT
jgi:hypothetical protein